ncbi:hypothetical protein AK830_g216 [Neonectria ditissima]|uniref:Uncharacterized protein n=1 Tax=Neonectria ditissima TaxID=78410 RepID=A0A0P7BQH4_9HYPO|nr:hypothetical protein AK830_g216 [Neonectria ditissima]
MDGRIVTLITGANRGIGYELARILLRRPEYHILLGSRSASIGNKAATALGDLPETQGSVESILIDVQDNESVDSAASKIASTHGRLDVLVNNAAINPESSFAGKLPLAAPARDVLDSVLKTNVTGAVSVTEAMLPLMRKSSTPRLIFVSSSTGSLTHASDPTSRFHIASRTEYRLSKTALNFIMVQYWAALKDAGFLVFAADPGLNATNLTGDADSLRARGASEPHIGAERIAKVVRGERDGDVGKVCGEYGNETICPW